MDKHCKLFLNQWELDILPSGPLYNYFYEDRQDAKAME